MTRCRAPGSWRWPLAARPARPPTCSRSPRPTRMRPVHGERPPVPGHDRRAARPDRRHGRRPAADGVLPGSAWCRAEMGRRSPTEQEALRAQAIVSRTFALRNLGRWRAQGFDLYATVADQVYGGAATETPEGRAAVEATRGRILTYGGAPIDAFFYSTCGGRTADGTEVFRARGSSVSPLGARRGGRRHGVLQHLAALPVARGVDRRGAPRHASAHLAEPAAGRRAPRSRAT